MALLQQMQGPQEQTKTPPAQGNDPRLQQVVTGMMGKLFPPENLQALISMLAEQRGNGMQPAVDAIVSTIIGLLKQGREQGKSLPIKVVMSALLPVLAKIAQGVEQVFHPVGEVFDERAFDDARAALDGVGGAEDGVDVVAVVRILFEA